MTYLITFTSYGQHLHGEPGSIDRDHNKPRTPTLEINPGRLTWERKRLNQPPYELDHPRREVVLKAIQEVSAHRDWNLLAAHVRTTHVHAVIDAATPPERVMNDFKTYATRRLNEMKFDRPDRKRWARHGSTRWLRNPTTIGAAIQYVVNEQGEPMSVFEGVVA